MGEAKHALIRTSQTRAAAPPWTGRHTARRTAAPGGRVPLSAVAWVATTTAPARGTGRSSPLVFTRDEMAAAAERQHAVAGAQVGHRAASERRAASSARYRCSSEPGSARWAATLRRSRVERRQPRLAGREAAGGRGVPLDRAPAGVAARAVAAAAAGRRPAPGRPVLLADLVALVDERRPRERQQQQRGGAHVRGARPAWPGAGSRGWPAPRPGGRRAPRGAIAAASARASQAAKNSSKQNARVEVLEVAQDPRGGQEDLADEQRVRPAAGAQRRERGRGVRRVGGMAVLERRVVGVQRERERRGGDAGRRAAPGSLSSCCSASRRKPSTPRARQKRSAAPISARHVGMAPVQVGLLGVEGVQVPAAAVRVAATTPAPPKVARQLFGGPSTGEKT